MAVTLLANGKISTSSASGSDVIIIYPVANENDNESEQRHASFITVLELYFTKKVLANYIRS